MPDVGPVALPLVARSVVFLATKTNRAVSIADQPQYCKQASLPLPTYGASGPQVVRAASLSDLGSVLIRAGVIDPSLTIG